MCSREICVCLSVPNTWGSMNKILRNIRIAKFIFKNIGKLDSLGCTKE